MYRVETHNLNPLETQLAECLQTHCALPEEATVLVAVSGGIDSMALLGAMVRLARQPQRAYRVIAAHLDHALRPESADDAQWVAGQAEVLGVPCVVERVNVAAIADQLGEGVEHAARQCRYDFLARAAEANDAQYVLTAHHAGDQAETVLFRMLRGTGLRGLGGMAFRRPLKQADDTSEEPLWLLRPMLMISPQQIADYCRSNGIAWRDDASNQDRAYRRNFLRHDVLPLLREGINDSVDLALCRLAAQAAEMDDYLTVQAQALLDQSVSLQRPDRVIIDTVMFAPAPAILRRTAFRMVLEKLGLGLRDLTSEHLFALDDLLDRQRGVVNLPADFCGLRRGSVLLLGPRASL